MYKGHYSRMYMNPNIAYDRRCQIAFNVTLEEDRKQLIIHKKYGEEAYWHKECGSKLSRIGQSTNARRIRNKRIEQSGIIRDSQPILVVINYNKRRKK